MAPGGGARRLPARPPARSAGVGRSLGGSGRRAEPGATRLLLPESRERVVLVSRISPAVTLLHDAPAPPVEAVRAPEAARAPASQPSDGRPARRPPGRRALDLALLGVLAALVPLHDRWSAQVVLLGLVLT